MVITSLDKDKLKKDFIKIWIDESNEFPEFKEKIGLYKKIENEERLNKCIDKIFKLIKEFSSDINEQGVWKTKIKEVLKRSFFISYSEDFPPSMDEFVNKFFYITETFFMEARTFDKEISIEDILQAMRNVWSMCLIQLLLEEEIEFTPSIFAYSMLYPYTDNYLDDLNISGTEKNKFNCDLKKRLKGELHIETNKNNNKIFKLIEMIEGQFERDKYLQVFESLVDIQEAQERSLIQHKKNIKLNEKELLDISVEKGGFSVLASGYLIKGLLTEKQIFFLYGYGFLLQLCDDLQDVKVDIKNNHNTLISRVGERWNLDSVTNNLFNFNNFISSLLNEFDLSGMEWIEDFVEKKMLNLLFFCVCKNKKFYSKKYFKCMEEYFPYRSKYIIKLNKKVNKKYKRLIKKVGHEKINEAIICALS